MRKIIRYPTNEMCDAFEVSRLGYRYFSSDKMPCLKAKRILKVYSSPRMTSELHDRGWKCSENTVATMIEQHGLAAKVTKNFKQLKITTVDKSTRGAEVQALCRDSHSRYYLNSNQRRLARPLCGYRSLLQSCSRLSNHRSNACEYCYRSSHK